MWRCSSDPLLCILIHYFAFWSSLPIFTLLCTFKCPFLILKFHLLIMCSHHAQLWINLIISSDRSPTWSELLQVVPSLLMIKQDEITQRYGLWQEFLFWQHSLWVLKFLFFVDQCLFSVCIARDVWLNLMWMVTPTYFIFKLLQVIPSWLNDHQARWDHPKGRVCV
jgi:hypothetical protein